MVLRFIHVLHFSTSLFLFSWVAINYIVCDQIRLLHLFYYLSVDRHWSCNQFLIAVNTALQIDSQDFFFFTFLKIEEGTLADVAPLVGPLSCNVMGLIPSQGMCLSCGFHSPWGCIRGATERYFSYVNVSLFLFLPSSLSNTCVCVYTHIYIYIHTYTHI